MLLCEGVKGRKEIGHLLGENTNDKVDKLGKLLVAQRVQLLDVAVQLLVWGRSTASEVELWHPEDIEERKKRRGQTKESVQSLQQNNNRKEKQKKQKQQLTFFFFITGNDVK